MINFKVSAPGKLILYGEHAVVYGKTALAASLDLRTTLEFEELESGHEHIHISLPKINILQKVSLKSVRDHFFTNTRDDSDDLYERVQHFVDQIKFEHSPQKLAMQAFFYLFVSITKNRGVELKPFCVHLDTMLSISSGLGSSASFAVCLTTCFVHYVDLQKRVSTTLDEKKLEVISQFALKCEKIMHGNPSGIDNAVCTYGSIVEFRKNDILQPITGTKSMRVLLVDTRVPRSTKALVEKVANLKQKYPAIFDPILDSIDNVSQQALNVIKRMKSESEANKVHDFYAELMTLIEVNQHLLSSCFVSHPTLDEICTEAKKYSLRGKLTGAGGGGYAYVLLLPDTSEEIVTKITNSFKEKGFHVTTTNLGGPGVTIHSC